MHEGSSLATVVLDVGKGGHRVSPAGRDKEGVRELRSLPFSRGGCRSALEGGSVAVIDKRNPGNSFLRGPGRRGRQKEGERSATGWWMAGAKEGGFKWGGGGCLLLRRA